jgi:hypothetical protein
MIMAVTCHSTEKSFEKYIKVTREETAKRMAQHMKMARSKKAMKAVGYGIQHPGFGQNCGYKSVESQQYRER